MARCHELFKSVRTAKSFDFFTFRMIGGQKHAAHRFVLGLGGLEPFEVGNEIGDQRGAADERGKDHRLAQLLFEGGARGGEGAGLGFDHRACGRLEPGAAGAEAGHGGTVACAAGEELLAQTVHLVAVVAAERGVAHLFDGLAERAVEGGLALGAVEGLALGLSPPEELDERDRAVELFLHGPCPLRPDQVVGVEALGHEAEAKRLARLDERQGQVDDAHRGAETGGVAVERNDRLVVHAPEELQLVLGHRGAEGRDGGGEPGLGERDHVHVAFGDDQGLALAGGLARGGVVVEAAALVEELGLG